MLRAPSGTARALASAISAATPIGVIGFPAAAQQVAAGPTIPAGPDFASCDARFKNNPAKHAQCYFDAEGDFLKASRAAAEQRIASGEQRIAAANTAKQCSEEIMGFFKTPALFSFGKKLLSERPDISDCDMRNALKAKKAQLGLQ